MKPGRRIQKTALVVTRWIGSPVSILIHSVIFAVTIGLLILNVFPFNVVILIFNTAISLEAIYLALFIQMTVNYQGESLEEVGEELEELQEDVGEIQGDIDEIQEDVDDIQEDVEEMSVADIEEEERKMSQKARLEEIHTGLQKLMQDIERLQKTKE